MKYVVVLLCLLFLSRPVFAQKATDTDGDGVSDYDEINIYHTDPQNPDTDGDGYNDWVELNSGHSPFVIAATLTDSDFDKDGLSDKLEFNFKTDPTNPDTDTDGFLDGAEAYGGFDPGQGDGATLEKSIRIDTKNQLLSYFAGDVRLALFPISTGKRGMETPSGKYAVLEKSPRRWSYMAKLWMPYWLMFDARGFGIHELPEWNDGTKEGAAHLGIPVSHGCVRLGVGPAEEIYNFADIGTKVFVN